MALFFIKACEWSVAARVYSVQINKKNFFLRSTDWTLAVHLSFFILEQQLHPSNCWWVLLEKAGNAIFFPLSLFLFFLSCLWIRWQTVFTRNNRVWKWEAAKARPQLSLIALKLQLMSLMVFSQPFIMIWEGPPFSRAIFFFIVIIYSFTSLLRGIFWDIWKVCVFCFISSVYLTLCQPLGGENEARWYF